MFLLYHLHILCNKYFVCCRGHLSLYIGAAPFFCLPENERDAGSHDFFVSRTCLLEFEELNIRNLNTLHGQQAYFACIH